MSAKQQYRLTAQDRIRVFQIIFPALAEHLLSQTFSMVDSLMLGHSSDASTSLAAIGITSSIINLIICVVNGFTIGTTATVAWFIGQKKETEAAATARQMLLIGTAVGAALTLIFTASAEQMVHFLNPTDETVRTAAVEYYRILCIGYVFQSISFSISASLRGCGLTQYPMIYNLAANGANVILNYILIYGALGFPAMRLRGAAIATLISKIIAAGIAFALILLKKSPVRISFRKSFLPTKPIQKRVLTIGLTAALEQILLQFGNVLFVKIIAGLPKTDLSANSVVQTFNGFIWSIPSACAIASTTLMGMHMGEGRADKCRAFTGFIIWLSVGMTLGLSLLAAVFRVPFCRLMINDEAVLPIAAQLMIAAVFSAPGVAIHTQLSGALRAAGDTKTPLWASFLSLWIFRVGLGWLLVDYFQLGIFWGWIAMAFDQSARAIINGVRYKQERWRDKIEPKHCPQTIPDQAGA